jgi:hypothetical protein
MRPGKVEDYWSEILDGLQWDLITTIYALVQTVWPPLHLDLSTDLCLNSPAFTHGEAATMPFKMVPFFWLMCLLCCCVDYSPKDQYLEYQPYWTDQEPTSM